MPIPGAVCGPKICTLIHRFPQQLEKNSVDEKNVNHYLRREIEPRSLRTLRLSSDDAISLTAVAWPRLNRETRRFYGSVWRVRGA